MVGEAYSKATPTLFDLELQPSFTNLVRHLPSWNVLSSKIIFRSYRSRGRSSGSSSYDGFKENKKEHAIDGSPNDSSVYDKYTMRPAKPTRTYVRLGKEPIPEGDGIHLQYRIEQESTSAQNL